jgi:hypothetical protein
MWPQLFCFEFVPLRHFARGAVPVLLRFDHFSMASTTDDDYNNLGVPELGSASSNLQTAPHLESSHFHSSALNPPDSQQPISPNVLELPSIVCGDSGGLSQEPAALHSRLSYEVPPSFRESPGYLTETLTSNINDSGSNTIGSFARGREVSFPA